MPMSIFGSPIPEVIVKYHKKLEYLDSAVKQILKEEEEERQVGGA